MSRLLKQNYCRHNASKFTFDFVRNISTIDWPLWINILIKAFTIEFVSVSNSENRNRTNTLCIKLKIKWIWFSKKRINFLVKFKSFFPSLNRFLFEVARLLFKFQEHYLAFYLYKYRLQVQYTSTCILQTETSCFYKSNSTWSMSAQDMLINDNIIYNKECVRKK